MPSHSLRIKNLIIKSGLYPQSLLIGKQEQVAILRYHAITGPDTNDYVSPNIALPADVFESQVRYFSHNYNIITMDTVADCIANNKPFPKKAVAITFDDGYQDNYVAYEILRKFGATGTFYVVVGSVGGGEPLWLFEVNYLIKRTKKREVDIELPNQAIRLTFNNNHEKQRTARKITSLIKSNNLDVRESIRRQLKDQFSDVSGLEKRASEIMLSWDQIREMSKNGMTIGGHTLTHLNLPNADPEDANHEIVQCKKLLEDKLQTKISHFSYPNGGDYAYYNHSVTEMVKNAGFLTSTTSNNGVADIHSNAFELKRIRVTPNLSEIYYQIEWEPIVEKLMKKS